MFEALLQDWTTVHVTGTATAIQSEPEWLDVTGYRDVTLWLETRGVLQAGIQFPILTYQTSPTKDDDLFSTLATFTMGPIGVTLTKVLQSQNPVVPLGTWLRWKLSIGGAMPNQEWGATFRIYCAFNSERGQ